MYILMPRFSEFLAMMAALSFTEKFPFAGYD